MRPLILVFAAVFSAVAQPLSPEELRSYLVNPLDFTLPETCAGIVKVFGEPRKQNVKRVRNRRNPEQTDEICTLTYDGLEVSRYRVKQQDAMYELALRTVITSAQYKLKRGLNVGTSGDGVRALLGTPTREERKLLVYDDAEGFGSLIFHLDDGVIKRIELVENPD